MMKIGERNLVDLIEATRAFARTVGDSPQYRAYEGLLSAVQGNREAQDLLEEHSQAQQALRMVRRWDGGSGEEVERVKSLETKLLSNDMLNRFFKAQEELVGVLKEVNSYMKERLGFDITGYATPAGGCC
jgi:cell fate (sporulation/competence/biofilm development) regulator YlbF (YheA/YmcA/DUF963 family)